MENITEKEEREFQAILNDDDELRTIYNQCFSKKTGSSSQDELEAAEAFAVHFVKMQLKKD